MKLISKLIFIFLSCYTVNLFSQQLTINDNFTEKQLVEDYLVQGCVEISNIQSQVNGSINNIKSFGYFEKASSNFPFENGAILSTGRAISGANGLNNAVLNEGQPSWSTDPDLENALGISGTLNATSIEFDFISISNQISFEYILASEEYFGNFPCEYSDGFALLIKRVDINEPYQNIAVIPGTNIPVNTKTIHDEIVGFCDAENEEHFEGYNLGDTNFNGRTKVMTATASIIPNVKYHIKLVIADQTDQNYDSAVFVKGNSFNADVDLGEDVTSCAESYTLYADIGNEEATYSWLFNGVEIPDETGTQLNVDASGTYTVEVTIPFLEGNCVIEDSVELNLSATQTGEEISDFVLCDDQSNDGVETFNLTQKNSEILESVPESDYNISYHSSLEDAENNINPIAQPIENTTNPQIIFVRIRDIINGCLVYSNFDLIVNERPPVQPIYDLFTCDDDTADGLAEIQLSDYDDILTSGDENLLVTYYKNENDADNGINALELPYSNSSRKETLYANVINTETGCTSVTTINFEIKENPVINQEPVYLDACDPGHDGFGTFNLNEAINDVLMGLTGTTVTFYTSKENAELGENKIPNPESFSNTVEDFQKIYVRVEDDQTGCVTVRSIEIHSNLLLTGTNIREFALCDANNGDNTFNLERIAEIIANDIPDVAVTFYDSENERNNDLNPIDSNLPYDPGTLPKFLYIRLDSPGCSENSSIELLLEADFDFANIDTVYLCDTDQDGIETINLSQFNTSILNGEIGYGVTYYETYEDADNGSNALNNEYTNIINPQTIYARIGRGESACYDVIDFQINFLLAPAINKPEDIRICEPDGDGKIRLNLEEKIPEIVEDTEGKEFLFFLSYDDAIEGINTINDPSDYYAGSQTIYVKVLDQANACPSIVDFDILVNTAPQIGDINQFEYCEMNSDGFGEFIFSEKDAEILNGQQGKEVFYYLNMTDADNGENEIDKNSSYVNLSNPQEIFLRVQNIDDPECFNTSSFFIAVGTSPEYNKPSDLYTCDDSSNDQTEIFDFTQIVEEVKKGHDQNVNISFHSNPQDAEDAINPLPIQYANVSNPESIFVRIGHGNACNVIEAFELNVVQVPNANQPEPLVICDPDQDQTVSFNLEDALINILDVRQDNIVVSYYETLSELENQSNPINNPQSYTNLTNPQTIYVRLTNTVSNCFNAVPLELEVASPPPINSIDDQEICATDGNLYDLSIYDELILDPNSGLTVSYYRSSQDANLGTNALDMPYRYNTHRDKIFYSVENLDNGCSSIDSFYLIINSLPNVTKPNDLTSCDDDYDGFLYFDLGQQNSIILDSQDPSQYEISYYLDIEEAELGINPLDFNYEAIDGERIYARVTNNTTGCYKLTDFMIRLYPLPEVDIPDTALCPEKPTVLISANTNIDGHAYKWSTGETTPEIEISNIGRYWVLITTPNGCETYSDFNIIESEPATIETTETIDFSDPNNITVTISGIGNYLYQLDNNEPQQSHIFERVPIGYHIVRIIDLNGCSSVEKEVLVIDTPKFMTPNGDGYWDYWHIIGVETLPGTKVQIFDRYGKKLADLKYDDKGWDGNHNGRPMPATDYWYVADVKQGGFEFQIRGHFALRR